MRQLLHLVCVFTLTANQGLVNFGQQLDHAGGAGHERGEVIAGNGVYNS